MYPWLGTPGLEELAFAGKGSKLVFAWRLLYYGSDFQFLRSNHKLFISSVENLAVTGPECKNRCPVFPSPSWRFFAVQVTSTRLNHNRWRGLLRLITCVKCFSIFQIRSWISLQDSLYANIIICKPMNSGNIWSVTISRKSSIFP